MAAPKTVYTCSACGGTNPKWLGRCPHCNEWNTLEEGVGEPTGAAASKNRFQALTRSQPGGHAGRHRGRRDRPHAHRHRGARSRAGRRHRRRRLGADRRRPGHRQEHAAAAGRRRAGRPDEGVVRHGRGVGRPARAALAPARPHRRPRARAGRDQPRAHPGHHRGRTARVLRHRLHPDALFGAAHLGAGLGGPGARVLGAAHAHRQVRRLHHRAGGPRHQGRQPGRPARAGAHRRHGALFRGRHPLQLPPGARPSRTASAPSTRSACSR